MLNNYPEDWQKTTLGDVAFYINGYAFKPEDWKEVGLPIVRIQQINDPEVSCDYFDGPIPEQYLIDDGDLLFSWSATLTTLIWNRGPAILNQHIYKVVPKENTDLHFLHHLLDYLMNELAGQTHGTTMKHITRSDLLLFPSYHPPLPEQRRIAEILDAADDAIRQTERVIAKLRQVKAGLLHDLLTRGLDAQGRLRDPDAHPEQFKDSPLGRIPGKWEITTLLDVAVGGISNGFFKKPSLVGSGYRLVNVLDLYQEFGIDLELVERVEASEQDWLRYAVKPGDCFFTRSSLNLAGIAHCNIVRDVPEPAVFECHVMRVYPNRNKVVPEFFAHWCRSSWVRSFFMERARQVTMTTIAQSDLAPLPVPLPTILEQQHIIETLDAADARIRAEEATLAKLRQVKHGLMDNLLTGRVRVKSEI